MMACMIRDISAQTFGRLTAIKPTGEKRWGVSLWECRCECGKTHIAAVNSLKRGLVQSCGCLHRETAVATATKHGRYRSPAYKSWDSMRQRCLNPNNPNFRRYGALGISVCDRWASFALFLEDMGERPVGTSLDRIDPHGSYTPGNCRWATQIQQSRNQKRRTTTFEEAEQVRAMRAEGAGPAAISRALGISKASVDGIIYLGQIAAPD